MALITCPECKKQISENAEFCPSCGYKFTPEVIADIKESEKKSQKNVAIGCLSVIIIIILFNIVGNCFKTPSAPTVPKTKEELRKESLMSQFSSWDGSHRNLTRVIKNAMNDPKSYEHVNTTYSDKGDYLLVKTVYRGKNAFGGVVVNSITAKTDMQGNVVKIISTEP